jgi:hypothetical protein
MRATDRFKREKSRYNDLEPDLPSLGLIQSPENLKSHVVDAD